MSAETYVKSAERGLAIACMHAFGLGPFALLPDLFTCVALVILLYLSLK